MGAAATEEDFCFISTHYNVKSQILAKCVCAHGFRPTSACAEKKSFLKEGYCPWSLVTFHACNAAVVLHSTASLLSVSTLWKLLLHVLKMPDTVYALLMWSHHCRALQQPQISIQSPQWFAVLAFCGLDEVSKWVLSDCQKAQSESRVWGSAHIMSANESQSWAAGVSIEKDDPQGPSVLSLFSWLMTPVSKGFVFSAAVTALFWRSDVPPVIQQ